MTDEQGLVRSICWRDCCPWFSIGRTFGLALSIQLLLLATGGVLATTAGWRICGFLFYYDQDHQRAMAPDDDLKFQETLDLLGSWPGSSPRRPPPAVPVVPNDFQDLVQAFADGPVFGIWRRLSWPFQSAFVGGGLGVRKLAYLVLGGLWTILVWAFFGAAITRSAALQLAIEHRPTLGSLVSFSFSKMRSYILAPLLPLVAALFIGLLIWIFKLVLMSADVTLPLAGLLWFLPLLGTLVMVLLLVGLFACWPLMWATISTEGSDSFDALSRSYGYTYQRPLHYLFYALLAALLGALGWFVVWLFSEGIVNLAFWSAAWGTDMFASGDSDLSRMNQIRDAVLNPKNTSVMLWSGAWLIEFWVALVRTVATAFAYSFFWVSMTAIYLLLRQNVDQTELDEVHADDDEDSFNLPPLEAEAGDTGATSESTSDSGPGSSSESSAQPEGYSEPDSDENQ